MQKFDLTIVFRALKIDELTFAWKSLVSNFMALYLFSGRYGIKAL